MSIWIYIILESSTEEKFREFGIVREKTIAMHKKDDLEVALSRMARAIFAQAPERDNALREKRYGNARLYTSGYIAKYNL